LKKVKKTHEKAIEKGYFSVNNAMIFAYYTAMKRHLSRVEKGGRRKQNKDSVVYDGGLILAGIVRNNCSTTIVVVQHLLI